MASGWKNFLNKVFENSKQRCNTFYQAVNQTIYQSITLSVGLARNYLCIPGTERFFPTAGNMRFSQ
jgi:hypothetical protein